MLRKRPDLAGLWESFFDLSNRRAWTAGMEIILPLPIPFQEILAYTELYGIVNKRRGTFTEIIRRMDDTFLEVKHKQIADEQRKKS